MKLNDNEDYQGRNTTKIAVSMSSLKLCCLHCPGKQENNYEETKGKKKKSLNFFQPNPNPKIRANKLILIKPCFNQHQLIVRQDIVCILVSEAAGINHPSSNCLKHKQTISSYKLTWCIMTRNILASALMITWVYKLSAASKV